MTIANVVNAVIRHLNVEALILAGGNMTPTKHIPEPKPDDPDDGPEVPLDEPPPCPIQDPPEQPDARPYVV
jgi:hypothetical protein